MANYKKTTKDDTVSDIRNVKVKRTVQKEVIEELTLSKLDKTISDIQRKIDDYTVRKNNFKAIRSDVELEAKKVKLLVEEEIEELIK